MATCVGAGRKKLPWFNVEMGMTLGAPREQPNDGVERTLKD